MTTRYKLFLVAFVLLEVYTNASESHFFINKTGCFKTKGCISFPESCSSSDDCDYLVTYTEQQDAVAFELSSKNEYAGFGLNTKQAMDGTDAIVCSKTLNGTSALVGHYLLHHHNTPSISKPKPSGLTDMAGAYENGRIVCRFKRSFDPTPPMKYNLMNAYYFMYARGKISDTGGLTHHVWRSISEKKQRLASRGPVKESNTVLIAIHAGLMLVAWIGFASVGIFTARNMKALLGQQTCCNVKLWFQLHRGCMALTTLFTIAGVVVIFIYAGGSWSKTAGWHAIIGVTVVSLATLQPCFAMCRPNPESPNRYIFNGLHRCIAFIVFVLAMTNCYLGVDLFNQPPLTNHRGFCVISTFIVAYGTVFILYEIYILVCCRRNKDEALLDTEIKDGKRKNPNAGRRKGNSTVGFVVYVFVILAAISICTTLLFFLVRATEKQIRG